jgi:hypothetical protein
MESTRLNGSAEIHDHDLDEEVPTATISANTASGPSDDDLVEEEDQGFDRGVVKEKPALVLRKPASLEWVRVNPEQSIVLPLFYDKDTRKHYLFKKELREHFRKFTKHLRIFAAVGMADTGCSQRPFCWPIEQFSDGRSRPDLERHYRAAHLAHSLWTSHSYVGHIPTGHYETATNSEFADIPQFPSEPIQELIKRAVGEECYIGSLDHPVAIRLLNFARATRVDY